MGPQDQSKPSPTNNQPLDLFQSRSVSGFLLWLNGPLHWLSKRRTITARSSAKAEIYATNKCIKSLLQLSFLTDGLNLSNTLLPKPITVYNDNAACVQCAVNLTSKGLQHIQIRENVVQESVQNKFVEIKHIQVNLNLSDVFTKEDKDVRHFIQIRNVVLTPPPS